MVNAAPMPDCSAIPPPAHHALRFIFQGLFILAQSVAFIWLIDRLADADWIHAVFLGEIVVGMAVAAVCLHCARKRRRELYDPLARLQTLLPIIRAGEASTEELAGVGGLLAPLAAQLQEILRDIKSQKSALAGQDAEVRQKIANRTEALERKIGSLKHQATRDGLTGLLNRRALDEHLEQAVQRCIKTGVPLSVLMIDVDNFKPLNDTLGHAAGDEFLRSLGQILRSTLRTTDAAFRCGGDEFIAVLESANAIAARALADRLVSLVDGLAKTMKVAAPPRLSIGNASLNEVSERTPSALLHEADMRLYAVKNARKRATRTQPLHSVSVSPLRTQTSVI